MEVKMPKRVLPLSNEEVLEGNYFKDWTFNQLQNLWPQMRFLYANGYTEKDSLLNQIREHFVSNAPGTGLGRMEKEYLLAVAVKAFTEGEKPWDLDL